MPLLTFMLLGAVYGIMVAGGVVAIDYLQYSDRRNQRRVRLPVAAIRSRRLRLQPGTPLQPTPWPDHVASDEWCRPTPDCACRACNCTCHGCSKGRHELPH